MQNITAPNNTAMAEMDYRTLAPSKLTDPNGNETRWEYDLQGRITKEIRADNTSNEYTYEATTSRLKQRTDPKGQIKTITYDLDNNQKRIVYSNSEHPTADVIFTYSPVYNRLASTTDGIGPTTLARCAK